MSTSRAPQSPVRHFSINAEDLPCTRRFYESVFGWRFHAWGPPGFYMIETGSADTPAVLGSMQQRREIVQGERINGFECTIAVPDIAEAERSVIANGGTIVMPRSTIPTVGHLFWFKDPDGNVVGAMQPDAGARAEG
jgi:predicted enzyme related to lactoylglutathione lyase